MRRSSRTRARALGVNVGALLATLTLLIPSIALAADFTVPAIPGAGWIQAPDNTAGEAAVIAVGPAGGVGTSSVELTVAATTDFVGIGRPIAGPLADITGGSWMTNVPGTSGNIDAEPAALKFGMYRLGGTNEFTTLVVEPFRNGTITANTWQETTLSGTTVVWQTNAAGAFCVQATPCTLDEFKAQYPNALVIGLQAAIGTGTQPVTSYLDGISLTIDGVTDTWNFELAAAPTATPAPGGGTTAPIGTLPPTDFEARTTTSPSFDGRAFIVLGAASLIAVLMARPRRRPTR